MTTGVATSRGGGGGWLAKHVGALKPGKVPWEAAAAARFGYSPGHDDHHEGHPGSHVDVCCACTLVDPDRERSCYREHSQSKDDALRCRGTLYNGQWTFKAVPGRKPTHLKVICNSLNFGPGVPL